MEALNFTELQALITSLNFDVNSDNFNSKKLENLADTLEAKDKMVSIIGSVMNTSTNGETSEESVLNYIKALQKKYVYVSLFTAVSYHHIAEIFNSFKTTIEKMILTNNETISSVTKQLHQKQAEIASLNASNSGQVQQLNETITSLQAELKLLSENQTSMSELENVLQKKVSHLSEFISEYTKSLEQQAGQKPEATEEQGGGKKKKQQKGGFVRDGTRAMLMGDPYPKAS
jgi:hypothetical protein